MNEAVAQSSINVAAASQGSTVRSYEFQDMSQLTNAPATYEELVTASCRAQFPNSAIIDGDRKGLNYGNGGVWSTCSEQYITPSVGTPYIQQGPIVVDFNQLRTINQINLFTTQDDLYNPVEPTAGMTSTTQGTKDFSIQYWDASGQRWTTITPGAVWSNNSNVWKTGSFDNITTSKIKIGFTANRVPASHKFSITEIEAFKSNSDHQDFGVHLMTSQALIIGNGQPALASYSFYPSYKRTSGSAVGYAPNTGEYYPITYSFSNIPSGMSMSWPGYRMYNGTDPCLHYSDFFLDPPCSKDSNGRLIYQPYGFTLSGNTNPGTYYITMTATEQLENGVTRAPYTHNYTFRLDVLGVDIRANAQEPTLSINSGGTALIAWTTFTDPDPAGYTQSGAPTCSTTNNRDATTWSGLSGSQNSGAITSPVTYTATCSYAGINLTDSVTINVKLQPPTNVEAFNTSSDSSVPCGAIKVTFTPSPDVPPWNNGGTTLYRDGFYANSGPPTLGTLYDGVVAGSPHSYTVRASKETSPGVWEYSDFVTATPSSIVSNACSGNFSTSDIDFVQIDSTGVASSLCSGETELPTNVTLKEGSVVRFRINLCNSGSQAASDVSFSSQLTNLFNPRNFSYVGCSPIPSSSGTSLSFSNIGTIAAGGACAMLFDATVQTEGVKEYVNRIFIEGTILDDITSASLGQLSIPPLPYFNSGNAPQRYESAP